MGFNGYFKLGETEIINSARTQAYVDAFAPSFGLRGCDDCEGLEAAIGDGEILSAVQRLSIESTAINRWRNPGPRLATGTGFAAYATGVGETGTTIYSFNGSTGVAREILITQPYAYGTPAGWAIQNGAGEVTTASNFPSGGPTALMQGYTRRTVTTAKTATGSSGIFYRESVTLPGLAGDARMFSAFVRFSVSTTVSLSVQYRLAGAIVNQANLTSVVVPANQWTLLQGSLTATGAYDQVQIWPTVQQIMPVGARYEMSGAAMEDPRTYTSNMFHAGSQGGGTAGHVQVSYGSASTGPAYARQYYGTSPNPALNGSPYFARRVIQFPKTSGSTGWQGTAGSSRAYFSAPIGTTINAAASLRFVFSPGMSARLRITTYDSGGNPLEQLDAPAVAFVDDEEKRLEVSLVTTQEFASVGIWAYQTGGVTQTPLASSVVDFGSVLVSTDVPASFPYFDGETPDTQEVDYSWAGAPSNSASFRTTYNLGREVLQQGGYRSPLVDGAPWMDSSNPALTDFWGVYPLAVDGLDDSTRTTTVTELTTDGAVMSIPRARAREIRYDAMLVGADDAAVDAGFHWLNRALDALRCDNTDLGCTGTELDFFSSCPPLCDYSGCSDVPIDWEYTEVGSSNNLEEERARWSASAGGRVETFSDTREQLPCYWRGVGFKFYDFDSTVTRAMTGLIPGQRYVVDMRAWANTGRGVRMSVSGADSSVDVASGVGCPWFSNSGAPWVLEFVASNTMHLLVIQTYDTNTTGNALNFPMILTSLKVTRVGSPVQAYQTSFPNDGSNANGWSPILAIPANTTYLAARDFDWNGSLPLIARWTATAAVTLPVGTGITRPLRGLVPGVEYTVRIFMPYSQHDQTLVAQPVRLNISGMAAGPVTAIGTFSGNGNWITRSFVATSDMHTISVVRTAATTLTVGQSLSMAFLYARVDRSYADEQLNAVTAGDVERYERTLYQVTALTGPTITERYNKESGSMIRVSFGLVAGVPHQFGPIQDVGSAIGGSAVNIVDVDCFEGSAIRRNLVPNPSIEVALTPWTGVPTPTRANLGAGNAPFGAYSMRQTGFTTSQGTIDGTPMPVLGGAQYTLSAYQRLSGSTATPARMYPWVTWYNAAGASILIDSGFGSTSEWENIYPATVWGRSSMRLIAPTEAATAVIRLITENLDFSTPLNSGVVADWDGIMFEDGNKMTTYFDGSTLGGHWTGTVGNSPSYWTAPETSELVDPDCPPLPAPPAPPQIDDSCVEQPDSWTRYTIAIPASDVPLFSASLPIVTISTGNASARQLRMRWYPNPGRVGIGEIEPCAYDGEIIVSYMPPQGEMEINTITRQAQATTDTSTLPQTATQLLYGPDGGPMVWPELSCNVPYIFTLDVDSAASVTELDVQLSLGLKV